MRSIKPTVDAYLTAPVRQMYAIRDRKRAAELSSGLCRSMRRSIGRRQARAFGATKKGREGRKGLAGSRQRALKFLCAA